MGWFELGRGERGGWNEVLWVVGGCAIEEKEAEEENKQPPTHPPTWAMILYQSSSAQAVTRGTRAGTKGWREVGWWVSSMVWRRERASSRSPWDLSLRQLEWVGGWGEIEGEEGGGWVGGWEEEAYSPHETVHH